jgi:hypothetical protein
LPFAKKQDLSPFLFLDAMRGMDIDFNSVASHWEEKSLNHGAELVYEGLVALLTENIDQLQDLIGAGVPLDRNLKFNHFFCGNSASGEEFALKFFLGPKKGARTQPDGDDDRNGETFDEAFYHFRLSLLVSGNVTHPSLNIPPLK